MTKTLTTIVRETVAKIDKVGPASVAACLAELRATGIQPGVHVGRTDMQKGSKECLEWYAGQILAVIDQQQWYAVNSLINCVDVFAPEGGP